MDCQVTPTVTGLVATPEQYQNVYKHIGSMMMNDVIYNETQARHLFLVHSAACGSL